MKAAGQDPPLRGECELVGVHGGYNWESCASLDLVGRLFFVVGELTRISNNLRNGSQPVVVRL